jgi:hypothetical protein
VFKSNTLIEDSKKGKTSVMLKAGLMEATSDVEVIRILQGT